MSWAAVWCGDCVNLRKLNRVKFVLATTIIEKIVCIHFSTFWINYALQLKIPMLCIPNEQYGNPIQLDYVKVNVESIRLNSQNGNQNWIPRKMKWLCLCVCVWFSQWSDDNKVVFCARQSNRAGIKWIYHLFHCNWDLLSSGGFSVCCVCKRVRRSSNVSFSISGKCCIASH